MTDQEFISDLWQYLDDEVAKLPPYLKDDEVTAQRLADRHPEQFKNTDAARKFLDEKVKRGELVKEVRRAEEGGNKPYVYVEAKTAPVESRTVFPGDR